MSVATFARSGEESPLNVHVPVGVSVTREEEPDAPEGDDAANRATATIRAVAARRCIPPTVESGVQRPFNGDSTPPGNRYGGRVLFSGYWGRSRWSATASRWTWVAAPACVARAARAPRGRDAERRPPRRRAVGRRGAEDRGPRRPGLRLPPPPGARGPRGAGDRDARAGYALEAPPDAFDLARFEQLLVVGRSALTAESLDDAAAAIETALGLWRGGLLDDLPKEGFVLAEARRVEELRLAAVELRLEVAVTRGPTPADIAELRALAAEHAFRERVHELLIRGLAVSGRQAESLEAYAAVRQALDDELGIEPGPALRAAQAAVLRQEVGPQRRRAARWWRSRSAVTARGGGAGRRRARYGDGARCRRVRAPAGRRRGARPGRGGARRGGGAAPPDGRCAQCGVRGARSRRRRGGVRRRARCRAAGARRGRAGNGGRPAPGAAGRRARGDHGGRGAGARRGRVRRRPDRCALRRDAARLAGGRARALLARAAGGELRLIGATSDDDDASRIVARAALALQRALGVDAEPVPAAPGDGGVLAASAGADVVLGVSERWRAEGLGRVRAAIATAAPARVVRAGVPAGLLRRRPRRPGSRGRWPAAADIARPTR